MNETKRRMRRQRTEHDLESIMYNVHQKSYCLNKRWFAFLLLFVMLTSSTGLSPLLRRTKVSSSAYGEKKKRYRYFSVIVQPWRSRKDKNALRTASSESLSDDSPVDRRTQRGMAAALFSTYFAVMGAKCALPSVLSLLMSPESGLTFSNTDSPKNFMASVLGTSTVAIAVGKAVSGPLIDRYGGILSLKVTLTLLMLLLASIATTQRFALFAVAWVLVDFIFASCWASCVNAIHQTYDRDQWAQQIGQLAAAARTGNAAAFTTFATVLHWVQDRIRQPWRIVFGVSAVLQILPIALLSYFGRFVVQSAPNDPDTNGALNQHRRKKSSLVCLKRVARTPEFWLHLCSRSALMVFGSFLLFVPTLMSCCYGMSSSSGNHVGSVFAIGCLLSVTTGANRYSKLSRRDKVWSVVSMMGVATLSALVQLGHMTGVLNLSYMTSSVLMFLWGLSFAIPFYIPPSMYALSRGGSESSATIIDVFDFGGFSLLALFNRYVASINHHASSAWVPTFQVLTLCGLTSLVTLALAVFFEEKSE